MQLNCKVIKKWQLPISASTPLFQGYPHFLAKFLVPPKWLNFSKEGYLFHGRISLNLVLYFLYSTGWRCCLVHLIKKLFPENFSKNSNLDASGISLSVFLTRTNLKLHNISVTPKMGNKTIMNLDLSRTSGPDCIPVVVLKNCRPELYYILAELFK